MRFSGSNFKPASDVGSGEIAEICDRLRLFPPSQPGPLVVTQGSDCTPAGSAVKAPERAANSFSKRYEKLLAELPSFIGTTYKIRTQNFLLRRDSQRGKRVGGPLETMSKKPRALRQTVDSRRVDAARSLSARAFQFFDEGRTSLPFAKSGRFIVRRRRKIPRIDGQHHALPMQISGNP